MRAQLCHSNIYIVTTTLKLLAFNLTLFIEVSPFLEDCLC